MILPLLKDAVTGRSFIDPEIETRVQEVRRRDEQSPMALLEPNEQAVARLRARKLREGKPFAVMFEDLEELKKHTTLSGEEQRLLTSWRRPIVLLKYRTALAPSVNNNFHRMGAMLPYMPFHHQLMEKLSIPAVVLTSGNRSDEPVILDNDLALKKPNHFDILSLTLKLFGKVIELFEFWFVLQ